MKSLNKPKYRRRKKFLDLSFLDDKGARTAQRRMYQESVASPEIDPETVYSSSLPPRAFERGDLFKER